MCFLLQVFRFWSVAHRWKVYQRKKELAKAGVQHEKKKKPFGFNFLKNWSNPIKLFYKRQRKKHRFLIFKLTTSGTFENYVLMAIIGLVVGIIISFIHFFNNFYFGDATLFWCFMLRVPMLVMMTSFLAFTQTGRCYLILAPIQIFSASGQVYIRGLVLMLVMGGPLVNLQNNLKVIQDSSSCQQRGVAAAAAEIADMLFGPFSTFKQAAIEIVEGIKNMVRKLQDLLAAFKRKVMALADAIQDATKWINSKINGCKNTVGTTYQHCMMAFSWMHDECKVNVPTIFVKMCTVTEFASNLCSSVKPGEYLCDLVYFTVDPLVTTINQRISRLWDRAYTLMFFDVNIIHEYEMDSNSKSIADELQQKLMAVFDSVNVMSFFIFVYGMFHAILQFLFLLAIFRYRSTYLRRVEFDNFFIDKKLKSLDLMQSLRGDNESIFPLRRVERNKYIKVTSLALVKKEMKLFAYPSRIYLETALALLIIGLDHLLYFITNKCRLYMLAMMQTMGSRTEILILGSGFIAQLSRRVLQTLNYMDYNFYYTHFMPCMPNPEPPNSWTNKKIYFYLILLWFTWLFMPHISRLRHIVMDYYHPDIADKRVRWLYNSIIFKRITFITLIQVKLNAKYGTGPKDWSIANILRVRFPWVKHIIGRGMLAEECMICKHVMPPLYRCPTQSCVGIFCDDCYINILGVCSLCREEMMHPDFKHMNFKPMVKEVSHSEHVDKAQEGFVILDEQDLEYHYQGKIANFEKKPTLTPEDARPSNDQSVAVYYSYEDENDLYNTSGFKYKRLREQSFKRKPSSYEETFEMF